MNENNINGVTQDIEEIDRIADTLTQPNDDIPQEPKKMTLDEITREMINRNIELKAMKEMKDQYAQNLEQFKDWCNILSLPANEYEDILKNSFDDLSKLSVEELTTKYPVTASNINTLEEISKGDQADAGLPVDNNKMKAAALEDDDAILNEDPVKATILAVNKMAADLKEWGKGIKELQNQQEIDVRTSRFLEKDYRQRIVSDEKASPALKEKAQVWLDRTADIAELGPVVRKVNHLSDTIMTSFRDNEKVKYAYGKFKNKHENSAALIHAFADINLCVDDEINKDYNSLIVFVLVWFACYSDRKDVDDILLYCEQYASGYLDEEEEKLFVDSINKIMKILIS